MKPTFEQWKAQLAEWMDERDIAVAFDMMTRCYHGGLSPAQAALAFELELANVEC